MTTTLADRLPATLAAAGVAFTLHEHAPSVTVQEAEANLDFPVGRILKTIAFRIKDQGLLLVGLCGYHTADYRRLAEAAGVNRTQLRRLEEHELEAESGYPPGGTAPFALDDQTRVVLDTHVLRHATIFCGTGRPDRTLEVAPADLVRVSGATLAPVARKLVCEG